MCEESELLRRYAEEGSDAAFTELVRRNVDLVYAAALRQVRDAHRAEDVVQSVFIDLARKARSLYRRPVLASWLYTSTRYAATKAVRADQRRQAREQEAQLMHEQISPGPEADWNRLGPILDDVMHDLDERDREAILLRYFKGLPFAEVGSTLRVTEASARQRVNRALDKMHALLAQRGITSTAVALGSVLGAEAVTAAPAGLGSAAASTALAAVTATGAAGGMVFLMSTTKLQLAIVTALVLASGVGLAVQHRSNAALRDGIETYRQEEESSRQARSAAEKRAADSLTKAAAFETQLAAAQAKLSDATRASAAVKSTGSGNDQPRGPGPVVLSKGEWLALVKEHPEVLEAQEVESKYNIEHRYGALFKNLNLTSEQIAQFEKLLIDKAHTTFDVYAAAAAQGLDPDNNKQEYNRLVSTTQADIEGKIKSLLGDSGYAQMQTFDRTTV